MQAVAKLLDPPCSAAVVEKCVALFKLLLPRQARTPWSNDLVWQRCCS